MWPRLYICFLLRVYSLMFWGGFDVGCYGGKQPVANPSEEVDHSLLNLCLQKKCIVSSTKFDHQYASYFFVDWWSRTRQAASFAGSRFLFSHLISLEVISAWCIRICSPKSRNPSLSIPCTRVMGLNGFYTCVLFVRLQLSPSNLPRSLPRFSPTHFQQPLENLPRNLLNLSQ